MGYQNQQPVVVHQKDGIINLIRRKRHIKIREKRKDNQHLQKQTINHQQYQQMRIIIIKIKQKLIIKILVVCNMIRYTSSLNHRLPLISSKPADNL